MRVEILKLRKQLKEYQSKIENGTLVDLPCKVGDTLYFVNEYRPTPRIETFIVSHFEITADTHYIVAKCYDKEDNRVRYSKYSLSLPNEDTFFIEAEAEARLQELLKENLQK